MDRQHEFRSALRAWNQAWDQFNQADDETMNYTIYLLQAAEERVSLLIRQARASTGIALPGIERGPAPFNPPGTSPSSRSASDGTPS